LPAPVFRSTATRPPKRSVSAEPTRNSIDTVSDRDFALEFLSLASICAVHLSRLAEEIVIWSTPQFGFVTPVGRLFDRLVDHAAEEKSGCGRTGPRQDRPHQRFADWHF
jgi:hypothetical protein